VVKLSCRGTFDIATRAHTIGKQQESSIDSWSVLTSGSVIVYSCV